MIQTRFLRLLAIFLLVSFGAAPAALPCTTFSLTQKGERIVGKSYDWNFGQGLLFVNKRNVAKRAVLLSRSDTPATWTSRYGSLTLSQFGREFPLNGVNEAGLVVEIMWLDAAVYPAPDARPAVNELQWIQYQLDQFASVPEVVAHLDDIRIAKVMANVHFMVCDADGACGTIEFVDGTPVVHAAQELPVPVLTNHTYGESLAYARQFLGFGGNLPIPSGPLSLDRFVRAASIAAGFSESPVAGVPYAFDVLSHVMRDDTQWNLVYDLNRKILSFRTRANAAIKELPFQGLDWSCATPVLMVDVNGGTAGDVSPRLVPYTVEANRKLVRESLGELMPDLPPQVVEALVRYPDSTVCRELR